jgi:hypothetical protein
MDSKTWLETVRKFDEAFSMLEEMLPQNCGICLVAYIPESVRFCVAQNSPGEGRIVTSCRDKDITLRLRPADPDGPLPAPVELAG